MELEWKDPPEETPKRVDQVAAELRKQPGKWAKIDHVDGVRLLNWWTPFIRAEEYEVRFVYTNPNNQGLGAPRDVYVRFKVEYMHG